MPPAVLEVLGALLGAGYRAFLVGGCVRDMVRGQAPKDFDLATSARPEQVQAVFKKVIPTGIQHGTVTVVLKGQHVEVTTFRAEGEYVDGRRPSSVSFHADIEADLGRRDFTINAMAYDPVSSQLVDPYGGLEDLQARLVRCVRNALERFTEDGLRTMRAVRFATVLDFELETETFAAIAPTIPIFQKVAMERVRDELLKVLLSPHVVRGLGLLERTGLRAAVVPELPAEVDVTCVARAPADVVLRLATWLWQAQPLVPVLERLKLTNQQVLEVRALLEHRELPPQAATEADLRRWLSAMGTGPARQLLSVVEARGADVQLLRSRTEQVLASNPPLTAKALALDGKGIMDALGVGPGAIVGQASRYLLTQVLDSPQFNTPEQLRALLSKWAPAGG